ncbi:MAG: hypothetical protein OXG97_20320 [Candidatus Poribacteria bacterium]|nr:hypothetical protein [Candidatus Poribacteria bacterium]
MNRSHRITEKHPRGPKSIIVLLPLYVFCFVLFPCGPGFTAQEEIAKFMDAFSDYKQKHKEAVTKRASASLNEDGHNLLRALRDAKGGLDAVLSSQPYLNYLKTQGGKAYEDFPTYFDEMPIPSLKSKRKLEFAEFFPPQVTPQEIQHCVVFYFKLRKLFTKEPDILDKNINKLMAFQLEHFNAPLMKQYSKEEMRSKLSLIMQLSMVPPVLAHQETQVYHAAWRKHLETHGKHEGLLRCAITCPEEFALTRSFFENAEALEKWIAEPLKEKSDRKEKQNTK